MTFSINFLIVLRRTICWKVLGLSYEDLFGFGIIIDVDFLK